ncbi:hypothetical protein ACSLBF_04425 [Pseudoalteromonas sp. T1lg65]
MKSNNALPQKMTPNLGGVGAHLSGGDYLGMLQQTMLVVRHSYHP